MSVKPSPTSRHAAGSNNGASASTMVASLGEARPTAGPVGRTGILLPVPHDEELAERLRDALAQEPGLTEKRMFGGVAFLLGGHMALTASSRGGLMVRGDPARADALLAEPGVETMVMRGRPMSGWLHVDRDRLAGPALQGWVDEGVGYVRSLPPK